MTTDHNTEAEGELTPEEQAIYEALKKSILCKIEAVKKTGEILERTGLVPKHSIANKIAYDFKGKGCGMPLGFVRDVCRHMGKAEWIGLSHQEKTA